MTKFDIKNNEVSCELVPAIPFYNVGVMSPPCVTIYFNTYSREKITFAGRLFYYSKTGHPLD